jgi:hypothetical protein
MKTMLDKCAVAGDITQAIDRRGAWSCAITVIGGTESTAVKLQSCETADGTFEDFKTLIPSADASASQYKGFVVDISGAGKFIKVVGATMATAVFGDCDYDVKKVAIKAGEIPSGADLENNKTATIDVSTYTEPVEIEPTAGKDGMKKATVTLTNIPSGGATAYAWGVVNQGSQVDPVYYYYYNFPVAPSDATALDATKVLYCHVHSPTESVGTYVIVQSSADMRMGATYVKVSDTEFTLTNGNTTIQLIRAPNRDFTLWG